MTGVGLKGESYNARISDHYDLTSVRQPYADGPYDGGNEHKVDELVPPAEM